MSKGESVVGLIGFQLGGDFTGVKMGYVFTLQRQQVRCLSATHASCCNGVNNQHAPCCSWLNSPSLLAKLLRHSPACI